MKVFGDIYVVKDSATACFVEFHYIVDGDQDFINGNEVLAVNNSSSSDMMDDAKEKANM